jgi:hypothetical protein
MALPKLEISEQPAQDKHVCSHRDLFELAYLSRVYVCSLSTNILPLLLSSSLFSPLHTLPLFFANVCGSVRR